MFRSLFRGREDVYPRRFIGTRLDTVLDSILRALANRRNHAE